MYLHDLFGNKTIENKLKRIRTHQAFCNHQHPTLPEVSSIMLGESISRMNVEKINNAMRSYGVIQTKTYTTLRGNPEPVSNLIKKLRFISLLKKKKKQMETAHL